MLNNKYIADVTNHPDTYRDDYFPFACQSVRLGMLACPVHTGLPNRHEAGNEYRYGFQGQEKDDEIKGEGNSINYKYRMHDPRVGRFFAVDPLTSKYPYYTPYSFSGNELIHMVELEGLEPIDPYVYAMKMIEYAQDGEITTWEQVKAFYYATYSSYIHTGLDVVGFIPVLGEVADGINGGLYVLEGNYVDAGFSFAAMVPIAGWYATTAKWTKNIVKYSMKYGDETANLVQQTFKHVDDVTKKVQKEIVTVTKSGTRADALKVTKGIVGEVPDSAEKIIGKFGSQKGKHTGYKWTDKDGVYHEVRLDYDPKTKEAHYNWKVGKESGKVPFDGTGEQVDKMITNGTVSGDF